MRRAAAFLLAVSAFLLVARLLTGEVYSDDSAETFLVLKHAPSLAISRNESTISPVSRDTVLDSDEMELAYGSAYRGAMTAAPYAFGATLLLWVLVRSRNLKRPSA
ncbi:hypothetical protein [Acetobacter sp. DsW_063]|uniref:hypothetical protein n=1 Tax=Acetobacter sp. DsW_063 TaxID=1514894 RepID=UPI000A3ADC2C|nr:hypothetical protein [Acetobacter sp. DsW_063]OUJ17124.1 hypothetical protein HK28_00010 [Acetobacter sp. DsW_063]